MNNRLPSIIFLLAGIAILQCGKTATAQTNDVIVSDRFASATDFVPGQILVKFKDAAPTRLGKTNGSASVGIQSVDGLIQKYKIASVNKLFPDAKPVTQRRMMRAYNGTTLEQPSLHNIYRLELSDPGSMFDAIAAFKANENVEYAEPNFILSIVNAEPSSPPMNEGEMQQWLKHNPGMAADRLFPPGSSNTQAVTPNDPLYSQQWSIGAIRADAVWESTKGDTAQVIAILDTGVDWLHPDLKNKIWLNKSEANGVAGVDDDGNELVDDIRGWDFVNSDNNPADDNSHGTHVAGIAAAEANNGIGIAGVNWKAKIMAVKVFQSSGRGDVATIAQGIAYAAQHGATVINMSFGTYARSLTMEAALANAYATSVLVAAAGNDGYKIAIAPFYPAALSYVLGVEATQQTVNTTPGEKMGTYLTDFTNYDPDGPVSSGYSDLLNYEIKAPGSEILSTIPNGNYRVYNGTSMAAPIVSGAVALYKAAHPDDSQELMWGNLINSVSSTLNLFSGVTGLAHPVLGFVSTTILDTLAGDDHNHMIDAGETIQVWFTVRNTWGQSDSVFAGLRLGEFEDTSVAHILNPTVFVGSISPYASRSNELRPFVINIAPTVAQGRDIVMEALCWAHGSADTTRQQVILNVQNGIELSDVMDSTLVLDANRQWLVNNSFRVGAHGVLTINPGTHLVNNAGIVNRGVIKGIGKADSLISITGPAGISGSGSMEFAYTQFSNVKTLDRYSFLMNADAGCSFSHCTFTNMGDYSTMCLFQGSTVTLTDNVFQNVTASDIVYSNSPMSMLRNNFSQSNLLSGLSSQWGSTGADISVARLFKFNNFVNLGITNPAYGQPALFSISKSIDSQKEDNNFIGFSTQRPAIITSGTEDILALPHQYWGSAKAKNIEKKIAWDFYLNPNFPKANLSPFLACPSDSAHGIVWKVLIDSIDPQDSTLDPIGVGVHRFDVYFNRPMDDAFAPHLAFGVRDPFNQQAVTDSGSWSLDRKLWRAYKTVNLYTGDGINTVSVTGAKDREGFEIPIENVRYKFLIDAAGASSLEFVATPGLGKIDLEWNKNDLADLLGFNMYRFTNLTDSTYSDTTLINKELITDTLYTDYAVTPGKNYYYLYKVVRTDFSESDYSRTVGAKALTSSPGDANGDLAVNVLDIVSEVSYILGQSPAPFIFAAADINADHAIDVLDIVGTINLILHPGGRMAMAKTAGSTARLELAGKAVKLVSDAQVPALQFTLKGAGMQHVDFTPDQSLSQFEVSTSTLGDTAKIILVYTMKGITLSGGTHTLGTFANVPVQASITDGIVADEAGKNILTNIITNGRSLVPDAYYLEQNFPNPFNMSTRIQFGVPERTRAKIVIYNILGQRVRTYDLGEKPAGRFEITWDGLNEAHSVVSSGVYFYRFESDKFTQARKLILLK